MKQCPKCGGQLKDEAKFCGFCGYALTPAEPQPEPYRPPTPQKKPRKKSGLIIGLIVGILVLAGAITAAMLLPGVKDSQKPEMQAESTKPEMQAESTKPEMPTGSTEPGVQTGSPKPGALFFRGEELWYANADGERLAADPGFEPEQLAPILWNLAISDDGRWVYFPQHGTEDGRDILVFRDTLDGDSKPQVLDRNVHVTSIGTNGDGSEVYYIRGDERTLCVSDREEIREIDEGVNEYAVVQDGSRIYYTRCSLQDEEYELLCWENGESRKLAGSKDASISISAAYNTGDLYYSMNEEVSPWFLVEDDLGSSPEKEEMRDFLDAVYLMSIQSLWWTDGQNTVCQSEAVRDLSSWQDSCSRDPDVPMRLVPQMNKIKLSEMDSLEELAGALEEYYASDSCTLCLAQGRELTLIAEDAYMGCLSAEGGRVSWLEDVDQYTIGRICTQTLEGKPQVLKLDVSTPYLGMQDGEFVFWYEDGKLQMNGENLENCDYLMHSDLGVDGFLYTYDDGELRLLRDGEEIILEEHLEGSGGCISEDNQGVTYRNSQGEIYFYDRGEPRLLAEDTDILVTGVWSRINGVPMGCAS